MSGEASNKWDEKTMLEFVNFNFDPKMLLSELTSKLGLTEQLHFAHQNLNGLSNSNYILENSTGNYFLRIQSKEASDNWFSSFEREQDILKCFQENNLGISPRVLYSDNSKQLIPKKFMVLEYIHGTQESDSSKIVPLVANCLKKLHAINVKDVVGAESILKVDEKFIDSDTDLVPFFGKLIEGWIINTGKEMLSEEEYKRLSDLYSKAIQMTKEYLPKRRHFGRNWIVHRDPHSLNFIKVNDELMLIDWEVSHLNHWSVDVVYFARHVGEEDEKVFMEIYGNPESDDEKLALWLQWIEQLVGAIGFFCNIYQVTKNSGATLPNIGDHVSAKMKLDGFIDKLEIKLKQAPFNQK